MKLGLGRLFETSKILNTKAGAELADWITFLADFTERVVRALDGNLTLADNLNGKLQTVSLTSGAEQSVNIDGKTALAIWPVRVVSATSGVDAFLWYVNAKGETVVKVTFTGSPTTALTVSLAILFA